jgi:MYXO-CTERM domain-containing protein
MTRHALVVAALMLFAMPVARAEPSVGLLGNSIVDFGSQNLPFYLDQWSDGAIESSVVSIPGGALIDHTENEDSLDLVDSGQDFIVLVEGTIYIFDRELDTAGSAQTLAERAIDAGSTPILFMSYAHGDWDQVERQETIVAFTELASALGVTMAPVAVAMGEAVDALGVDDFYADERHLTADGHFLSGCILHATLMGLAAEEITYSGSTEGLLHHDVTVPICRDTIAAYAGGTGGAGAGAGGGGVGGSSSTGAGVGGSLANDPAPEGPGTDDGGASGCACATRPSGDGHAAWIAALAFLAARRRRWRRAASHAPHRTSASAPG